MEWKKNHTLSAIEMRSCIERRSGTSVAFAHASLMSVLSGCAANASLSVSVSPPPERQDLQPEGNVAPLPNSVSVGNNGGPQPPVPVGTGTSPTVDLSGSPGAPSTGPPANAGSAPAGAPGQQATGGAVAPIPPGTNNVVLGGPDSVTSKWPEDRSRMNGVTSVDYAQSRKVVGGRRARINVLSRRSRPRCLLSAPLENRAVFGRFQKCLCKSIDITDSVSSRMNRPVRNSTSKFLASRPLRPQY